MTRSFASDNQSAVHPAVLGYLGEINEGHSPSYDGNDVTDRARAAIGTLFDGATDVLFVGTGTAANILGLTLLLTRPYDAVVMAAHAHIASDETGALARHTGAQLFPVEARHGKVSVDVVAAEVHARKELDIHSALPKVVSIANSTELGTVYTPHEVAALAAFCHAEGLYLHMDGCRLPNAAAALGCDLADLTCRAGVDVLSFGGAKNGLMSAEAVLIFDAPESSHLRLQKQVMHLTSKVRYVAGQFVPYVEQGWWRTNAEHANAVASQLADALVAHGVELTAPVETNQVFCRMTAETAERLRAAGHRFYDWHGPDEVRFVTSWDTTAGDVAALINDLAEPPG